MSYLTQPAWAETAPERAVRSCHLVESAPTEQQRALLVRGIGRAEALVASRPDDPVAHFAVFCFLAKRLRISGVGFRTLGELRRMRRELDVTLSLAPDYVDALAAKGALLLRLPRLFGGDVEEGERLLRGALLADPDDAVVRLILVQALIKRGARSDARTEAVRALEALAQSNDQAIHAEANTMLAELCDQNVVSAGISDRFQCKRPVTHASL